MSTIGPWEIIGENVNERNYNQNVRDDIKNVINGINNVESLFVFWKLLHLYYIFSRTLKYNLFIEFKNENDYCINLYIPYKESIKPPFINKNALSIIPEIERFIKNDTSICKKVVSTMEYNRLLSDEQLQDHICDFSCQPECKYQNLVLEELKEHYHNIGLVEIMSWCKLHDIWESLQAVMEIVEIETEGDNKKLHQNMEFLYNLILGSLIKISLENDEIKLYTNIKIKPIQKLKSDMFELDIVLLNESKRKILNIEGTAHYEQNNNEWYEHFQKKLTQSMLLSNEAYGYQWEFKTLYFYLHAFNYQNNGAFNVIGANPNSFFVPIQMWDDFSEFSKIKYIWEKKSEHIIDHFEKKLEQVKKELLDKVSEFFNS